MNFWSGQCGQPRQTARRLVIVAASLLSVIAAVPAFVQGNSQVPAEDLVQQLGSRSFRLREQAEHELRQLGVDVLPVLEEAVEDRNLEVRFRVRRLMQRIEHQHQLRLLERFLTDYDPELAQQLPGWLRFAELVGEDLESRRLFVAMYEAEPEVMSLLGRSASELSFLLETYANELRPQSGRRPALTVTNPAATAVLLFASLDPAVNTGSSTKSAIHGLVKGSAFGRAVHESADPPIRRLLGAWVSHAQDVHAGIRMSIGNDFDLRAAVDPALELIASRVGSNQLQQAVFTLAKFGTAEQIPVLERLFDNQAVLAELQRGEKEVFTCQIRDVALVAAIHLIGKHPYEFGYHELRPNANSLYALNTAGFDSEEHREAAFRLWTLWSQVQRREFRTIDENAVEGITL